MSTRALDSVELARPSIGGGSPRSSGEATPSAAVAAAPSSEVSITNAAAQLAGLEQALQALPAVDAARVSALRAALASGEYVIEPQSIASGLIGSEQALSALSEGGG